MKNKKYIVYLVVSILVLTIGVSYAYFKARVSGEGKSISLRSKGIYVLYSGDATLASENISPGWSVTKEFTVENQGSNNEVYNIYIEGLVNTFVTSGYLQYKITSSNGYNMSEYKDIPKSNTSTDTVLAYSVPIKSKEKQTYKVELIYKETEEDQSVDMGKILSGILGIQVGTKDPNLFTASVVVINGSSDTNSKEVYKGNDVTFTITPNEGYTLEDASISCSNGTLSNNLLTISNVQSDITCTITLGEDGPFKKGTLAYQILQDNPTVSTRTDFITNIGDTTGTIYVQSSTSTSMMTEDVDGDGVGEDVYYYSGYTTNNFVKFAKRGNNDLYWRIIRTNEDRSVRMLYYGYSSGSTIYYGTGGIDQLKGTVISGWNNSTNYTWYENYLLNDYDKYISKTAIYCLDRSIGEKVTNTNYYYGASKRGYTSPTYKCGGNGKGGLFESAQRLNDKFSASTSGGGNGQLKYPIALINADEIAYAGKMSWHFKDHENNFLGNKDFWWTMSLGQHKSDYMGIIRMCTRRDAYDGLTETDNVYYGYIFPVISLKACVKYASGDGSSSNPYQVTIDSACENSEN